LRTQLRVAQPLTLVPAITTAASASAVLLNLMNSS
jgi:hypothetical protein